MLFSRDRHTSARGSTGALGDALDQIGYTGDGRIAPERWAGFLELHIEQDTTLEQTGVDVGVVTTIAGEADHAGATAMGTRADALAAAAAFARDIEQTATAAAEQLDPSTVGTIDSLSVEPGAANVAPACVTASPDARATTADGIDRVVTEAKTSFDRIARERGVTTQLDRRLAVTPTPMADSLRTAVHNTATGCGAEPINLAPGGRHTMRCVWRT